MFSFFLFSLMFSFVLQLAADPKVSDDEKKKLEEEFQEYYKKLEQAKEESVSFFISPSLLRYTYIHT